MTLAAEFQFVVQLAIKYRGSYSNCTSKYELGGRKFLVMNSITKKGNGGNSHGTCRY